jgi:hypothetical protein
MFVIQVYGEIEVFSQADTPFEGGKCALIQFPAVMIFPSVSFERIGSRSAVRYSTNRTSYDRNLVAADSLLAEIDGSHTDFSTTLSIRFSQCLHFLRLLQERDFKVSFEDQSTIEEIKAQQDRFFECYRRNRLDLSLPKVVVREPEVQ